MAHKVVINTCIGTFGLSEKAVRRYEELSGKELPSWDIQEIKRHDPALIKTIEELGEDANGGYAYLEVREIPGNRYQIVDAYEGSEELWFPEIKWIVIEED